MGQESGCANLAFVTDEEKITSWEENPVELNNGRKQPSTTENAGATFHLTAVPTVPSSISSRDSPVIFTFAGPHPGNSLRKDTPQCILISHSSIDNEVSDICQSSSSDRLDDTKFRCSWDDNTIPKDVTIMKPASKYIIDATSLNPHSNTNPIISLRNIEDPQNERKDKSTILKFYTGRKKLVIKAKKVLRVLLKFLLTYPLICLAIWALLFIYWGKLALPGGSLFALIVLLLSAIVMGQIVSLIDLPPLFGMLVAGMILRNVPYINIGEDLTLSISSPLRVTSVVVLLTRGAFSVDPAKIRKYKAVVPSLAIGSCVIEAIFGGISVYFIIGFPPAWAAAMGCIMSAMSGAGVMPYLLNIERKVCNDNVHTTEKAQDALTIAKTACGLDAILGICMAEVCFGFIFGEGDLQVSLLKGIVEVIMGGSWGLAWGLACGLLLAENENPDFKIIGVFAGGVSSLLGLTQIGYPRGGPLGVFSGALIAVTLFRRKKCMELTTLTQAFDKLWFIFQPLLFMILGSRTDFLTVDWNIIYKGAICLAISTVGRIVGSYLMTHFSGLSFRERLFLVVSWCGKGTVQAALGPVILDTCIDLNLVEKQNLGYQIMNLAAMVIFISSLFGFLLLKLTGPRILTLSG